ncbi:carboxypeptidase regulatory-like domain-containing protein [Niabella ginsengisoli]|uniref:Carboxypeptidase-like regulatory domain-containing protein n=1 Tax=Niabella ginsengisoli TaxID=522298 RepID=A0ABS9SR27_9BACT|nr:carboxypeptidase regulatory-like domain-containing protein [Niabella ginsengisoli]MCH5600826.1 carboxypeptidase-like regulatory domain-containing protein [Niabella ginsengisoli]
MKFILMLCCMLACSWASAQLHQVIVTVSDDYNIPVSGAIVTLQNSKTAVSDSNGRYIFKNVNAGDYKIIVSLAGYKTVTRTASVKDHDVSLIVRLHPESHTLQEVKVQSNSIAKRKKKNPLTLKLLSVDLYSNTWAVA